MGTDLDQAAQQVAQAQAVLQSERQRTQQAQQQIDTAKQQMQSQQYLRVQQQGLAGLGVRQRTEAQLNTSQEAVTQRSQAIEGYQNTVDTASAQISAAKAAEAKYQAISDAYTAGLQGKPIALNSKDEQAAYDAGQNTQQYNDVLSGLQDQYNLSYTQAKQFVNLSNQIVTEQNKAFGSVDSAKLADLNKRLQTLVGDRSTQQIQNINIPVVAATPTPAVQKIDTGNNLSNFFNVIPSVSAMPLNTGNASGNNGLGGSAGNVPGASGGNDLSQSGQSNNSGFFANLAGSFKKAFESDISQTKEQYVSAASQTNQLTGQVTTGTALPSSGLFAQNAPGVTSGSAATPILRVPTTTELAPIQAANTASISQNIGQFAQNLFSTKLEVNPLAGSQNQGLFTPVPRAPQESVIGVSIPQFQTTAPRYAYETAGTLNYGYNPSGSTTRTIDISGQNVFTPEQIGKATAFVAANAPYATPFAPLFIVEPTAEHALPKIYKEGFFSGVKSYAQEYPGEALTFGIFAGLGTAATIKYATASEYNVLRTTTNVPGKEPDVLMIPKAKETIILPTGENVEKTSFSLFGKASGGATISTVEVTKTSPIRDLFGIKPKVIYSSFGEGSYSEALAAVKGQYPSLNAARTAIRTYSKSPVDINIRGEAQVLTGLNQPRVNVQENIYYQPKQINIGGGKVSRSFAPFKEEISSTDYLVATKGDINYYASTPSSRKLFYVEGNPSQTFMKISQQGRTTDIFNQLSASKQTANVNIPMPTGNAGISRVANFDIYKTESITNAGRFGRARVVIPSEFRGVSIDYGQPVSQEFGGATKAVTKSLGSNAIETTVSKITLPRVSTPKAPASAATSLKNVGGSLLPSVSAKTAAQAALGGQVQKQTGQSVVTLAPRQNAVLSTTPATTQETSQGVIPVVGAVPIESVSLSQPQAQQQGESFGAINIPAIGSVSATGGSFSQQNRTTSPAEPVPRAVFPFLLTPSSTPLSKKTKKRTTFDIAYDVFIRRHGKEVKIASGLPLGLANKAGVTRNLQDLSRSFKLRPHGTTTIQDINYQIPGKLFRPSKREAGRIVQKAQFSLASVGERSEIKSARRRASKRVRWFS